MLRRRRAANERAVTVVDFYGDPAAESRLHGLQGNIAARLQGAGGAAYIGDKGDPTQSFAGYAAAPQDFRGAAGLAANANVIRDRGANTIDTLPGNSNDPALRIFADRLRRQASA